MCTKNEIAEVIEQEFFKEGGLRDQLSDDITTRIDAKVGRWLLTGGLIVIVAAAGAWFTLKNTVSNNTEKIENALTQDQAALIIQRVDQLKESVDDKNEVIQRLDERLRAKGI